MLGVPRLKKLVFQPRARNTPFASEPHTPRLPPTCCFSMLTCARFWQEKIPVHNISTSKLRTTAALAQVRQHMHAAENILLISKPTLSRVYRLCHRGAQGSLLKACICWLVINSTTKSSQKGNHPETYLYLSLPAGPSEACSSYTTSKCYWVHLCPHSW